MMSKKNKADQMGFVYSTNPDFSFSPSDKEIETLVPSQQKLRVRIETKHRAGKMVTVVAGFIGKETDVEILGKQLKNFCGTGGSAKDAEIIVQGDQKAKVIPWLIKNGYTQTK